MSRFAAHSIRSLKRDQGGSVAVEFALVAPILLFVLAGVIDIGSAVYARLSLDARVTAAADYALLQSGPEDQQGAENLATSLVGMLQGDVSGTAEVIVNNAARGEWTGSVVTTSSLPGDAGMCYCPSLSDGDMAWGAAVGCGTTCATGDIAGQFLQISASARHVTIFPGYAFIDGDTVNARAVVRMQ